MRSTRRLPFGFNPKVEHRNQRLRRLVRKHGKPTRDELNAAVAQAGHKPQVDAPAPTINHALRKTLGE